MDPGMIREMVEVRSFNIRCWQVCLQPYEQHRGEIVRGDQGIEAGRFESGEEIALSGDHA